mmetsp:Transcript_80633/g.236962  ORF Transcript_80633/g.236962 Transcript_80633/m.236962 type:complete len:401 (-) Transcript_80633:108-1310(-)
MFDFDGLEAEAPPPAKPTKAPVAAAAAAAAPRLGSGGGAKAAPSANGAGADAADAMIAKLKQAAWDAEEAARPPPAPEPKEEEEVVDAAAAAAPTSEAEPPRLSPVEAEAEHSALLERLRRAAEAFNEEESRAVSERGGTEAFHEQRQPRSLLGEDPVIVGSALFGRSAYDAPYIPSAEKRAPVQVAGDGEGSDNADPIRDYSGPVANAIAFARQMRASRAARDKEAAATAEKEVEEAEPEVPFELSRAWEPETALFRISERVLPMHLERTDMTPCEVTRIWEQEWGIAYAGRLRFEAPPESGSKWLNPRLDVLPAPPAVTRLDGKAAILDALALALTQRDEELLVKSMAEGKERQKEDVGHGGKWSKKSETFRWSSPAAFDPEDDGFGKVPIWPPMEPP